MAVNTATVEGRRKLDFGSYQEMLADADRVGSGPVAAVDRLEQEPHRAVHPVFGPVKKREEWDRIHHKHASLHLSFLIPQA